MLEYYEFLSYGFFEWECFDNDEIEDFDLELSATTGLNSPSLLLDKAFSLASRALILLSLAVPDMDVFFLEESRETVKDSGALSWPPPPFLDNMAI